MSAYHEPLLLCAAQNSGGQAREEKTRREGGAENTQWGPLHRFKEPCWALGNMQKAWIWNGTEGTEEWLTKSNQHLLSDTSNPSSKPFSGIRVFSLMTIFPKYLINGSPKQGDYGMEMHLETTYQLWLKVTFPLPHKSPAKACFTVGWGGAGWGGVTMLTKLSHFIGNQHINSVGPQSFALSRGKAIPTLQGLGFIENSSQPDPLLIRDKTGRDQAPVLKATGMLLRPQKMQGSKEPHFL